LEYGQDVDDLRLKVVGWWRTGSTHIQRGDVEQGLQCCEAALALAPAPFDTAMIKAVRGHGWVKGGKEAAGTAELTAAVAWFERSRLGYTRAVFALRLGEAYLRQGEWLRARSLFQEVLTLSQEAGYRHLAGVAERFLGASLVGEDPAAAAAHVAGAVQSLEQMGARNEMAKGWVTQATLRHRVGDRAGARKLLERALTLFERLGTLDEPCRVRAALATLQDSR
jgi:tetratricopeptide (TPR) repeat protein